MKEQIKKLQEEHKKVCDAMNSDKIANGLTALVEQGIDFSGFDVDKLIIRVKESDKILIEKLYKIRDEIKELQKNCKEHNMIYDGHDSHRDYYKCSICGHEDWS